MNQINQEHIKIFSDRLKAILNDEIKLGNEIKETSVDWPYKGGVSIFMRHPFMKRYHLFPNIIYNELTDRHYWQAEYFDRSINHLPACPF